MKGGLLGLPGMSAANVADDVLRRELAQATTLQGLIDLGVERGFSLWPEWGLAFTHLDKGGQPAAPGQPAIPGIENRPNPPPKGLIGKRIAFHMGAHIGGSSGASNAVAGIGAMLRTAASAGWSFTGNPPHTERFGRSTHLHKGSGVLAKGSRRVPFDGEAMIVTSAITFTAVITGFEQPTDSPKYPWQHASDPEDSEDWSYGWHVTDVVVLRTPIPCAGLQGPWTLAGAIAREAKRKAKAR